MRLPFLFFPFNDNDTMKILISCFIGICCFISVSLSAFASDRKIDMLHIVVTSSILPGSYHGDESIEVKCLQSKVDFELYNYTTEEEMKKKFVPGNVKAGEKPASAPEKVKWKDTDVPMLELVFSVNTPGYVFGADVIKYIQVDGAVFLKAERRDENLNLIVYVKLYPVSFYVGDASNVCIAGDWGYWDKGNNADYYEYRVYRDNAPLMTSERRADGNGVSLKPYINRSGRYKIAVRSVKTSVLKSEITENGQKKQTEEKIVMKGSWIESEEIRYNDKIINEIRAGTVNHTRPYSGGWRMDAEKASDGSDGKPVCSGWQYQWSNGSESCIPQNQWVEIDGKKRYFDNSGFMLTGWLKWNGKEYYFDKNGVLASGGVSPEGYMIGSDGSKKAGGNGGKGPRIITQPQNYTGPSYGTAVFVIEAVNGNYSAVVVSGETPSDFIEEDKDGLTYQWQYQAPGSPAWVNASEDGNQQEILWIYAAARSGCKFRCIITDAEGWKRVSDEAELSAE